MPLETHSTDLLCLSFHYWDHNDARYRIKMHEILRYDKCFASSRSVLGMLSRSVEVVQEAAVVAVVAVVVVVEHNGRKGELPALFLLLVSHLVVVGLHRHEFVHQLCHLLDVVLLVKHAVLKNGKDLLPPRLLDIVLDNTHHLESVFLLVK